MGGFQKVYSDTQRLAVQQAWGDHNIRPAKRIAALAAEGALTLDGELVPAFKLTAASAADIGRRYLRKREKHQARLLAESAPKDSVELIRRRLIVAVDEQLSSIERRQARNRHRDVNPEELRQIARAAQEIARLPGPNGEPPVKRTHQPAGAAGSYSQATKPSDGTRSGLAGQILKAAQPNGIAPVQSDAHPTQDTHSNRAPTTSNSGEHTAPATTQHTTEPQTTGESEDPGLYASERIAAMGASVASVRPA